MTNQLGTAKENNLFEKVKAIAIELGKETKNDCDHYSQELTTANLKVGYIANPMDLDFPYNGGETSSVLYEEKTVFKAFKNSLPSWDKHPEGGLDYRRDVEEEILYYRPLKEWLEKINPLYKKALKRRKRRLEKEAREQEKWNKIFNKSRP